MGDINFIAEVSNLFGKVGGVPIVTKGAWSCSKFLFFARIDAFDGVIDTSNL